LAAILEDSYARSKPLLAGQQREVEGYPVGKVGKGIKCSVAGCAEGAVRSVSPVDVSKAGLRVSSSGRSYLCKNHYKEMKKKLRKDKEIERWRMRP